VYRLVEQMRARQQAGYCDGAIERRRTARSLHCSKRRIARLCSMNSLIQRNDHRRSVRRLACRSGSGVLSIGSRSRYQQTNRWASNAISQTASHPHLATLAFSSRPACNPFRISGTQIPGYGDINPEALNAGLTASRNTRDRGASASTPRSGARQKQKGTQRFAWIRKASLDLPLTSRSHTTSFSDGIVLVRDYGAHLSGARIWKRPGNLH